jgi:tetratricopeptide (TPR) repeat protein
MCKFDEAEGGYLRALALVKGAFGDPSPYAAIALCNLGHVYRLQGDLRSADATYARAIAAAEGGGDGEGGGDALVTALNGAAVVARAMGRGEAARMHLSRVWGCGCGLTLLGADCGAECRR